MKLTSSFFIILLISITAIIYSCTSSEKLLNKGRYKKALQKAEKRIKKDPNNYKEIDVYMQSYNSLLFLDSTNIYNWELSNDHSKKTLIYNTYLKLKKRQERAQLLAQRGLISIRVKDFDKKMTEAKNKALKYEYDQGLIKLNENNRFSARVAYNHFQRCINLKSDYLDARNKMNEAYNLGQTNVFITVKANNELVIRQDFYNALAEMDIAALDSKWVKFDQKVDSNKYYPYSVMLRITNIQRFPERLESETVTETKRVASGKELVLDEKGAVKKDLEGNDVTVTKYRNIKCSLKRYKQFKRIVIYADLFIYNNESDNIIKKQPITSESVFSHTFANVVSGNTDALSNNSKALLDLRQIAFPPDTKMILDGAESIKIKTKSFIRGNTSMFE